MRAGRSWRHCAPLCVQHDVASFIARRCPSCTEPPTRLPWKRALLIDSHAWPLELCARILLASIGLCKFAWRSLTLGHLHWLLPCKLGNRMVHLLKLSHVLRCGAHDQHERTGSLSSGTLLRWIRDHGRFLKSGYRANRPDDESPSSLSTRDHMFNHAGL